MAAIQCPLSDATLKFQKLSLRKPNKAIPAKVPHSVGSKPRLHNEEKNTAGKENKPRCKAALHFGSPKKNDSVIEIFDDSLTLQDLEEEDKQRYTASSEANVSNNQSSSSDMSPGFNPIVRKHTKKIMKRLSDEDLPKVTKDDVNGGTSIKKKIDFSECSRILCELYGRECLTTPGLFKRVSLKGTIDDEIAKVLDFDDEDDGEVAFKTPPPSRPIVSRAVTERKPKRTIPNVQAELKVDHLKDLPKYDFVQSLADDIPPWRVDESAKPYLSNFKKGREELTTKLFQIFSDTIFSSRLVPSQIPVTWDTRLLTTAGMARNKRDRHGQRSSSISLSVKVITSCQMLRDTLVHEMCHCATWIIDGQLNEKHGQLWKKWGAAVTRRYPLLKVERCHRYKIEYKYTYKCVICSLEIKRHSKSVKPGTRCEECLGTFELLVNKKLASGAIVTTPASAQRQAGPFANYVREYYFTVKQKGRPHAEVMKILGRQFALLKSAGLT